MTRLRSEWQGEREPSGTTGTLSGAHDGQRRLSVRIVLKVERRPCHLSEESQTYQHWSYVVVGEEPCRLRLLKNKVKYKNNFSLKKKEKEKMRKEEKEGKKKGRKAKRRKEKGKKEKQKGKEKKKKKKKKKQRKRGETTFFSGLRSTKHIKRGEDLTLNDSEKNRQSGSNKRKGQANKMRKLNTTKMLKNHSNHARRSPD